jgi:hypothetical protein
MPSNRSYSAIGNDIRNDKPITIADAHKYFTIADAHKYFSLAWFAEFREANTNKINAPKP